ISCGTAGFLSFAVSESRWEARGSSHDLGLRSGSVSLDLTSDHPGLVPANWPGGAHLLALPGLAQGGLGDGFAFRSRSRIGWDLLHGRLAATFAPEGWGGLVLRAAWSPVAGRDGVDLEIQASTDKATEFSHFEVCVLSRFGGDGHGVAPRSMSQVEAR